jgi:predicted HTH transcriptional regulator
LSGPREIMRALRSGPMTNAQLQEATCDHSGSISRYMAALIKRGKARRVDGQTGRGTRAIYGLVE